MLNSDSISLIKGFEKLVKEPYLDAYRKIPTIGYGNTYYENGTKVSMSDAPITEQRANELFTNISSAFSVAVYKFIKPKINLNQLGALTSLAYNIGLGEFKKSSLLKKVNINPEDASIEREFQKFIFSNGKKSAGLLNRRNAEYQLYKKKNSNLNIMEKLKALYQLHKTAFLAVGAVILGAVGFFIWKKYKK